MIKENKQHIAGLTITGLCSGIITSILLFILDNPFNPFVPGIVFSLVIALYFLSLQTKKALLSTCLFIIFSIASYALGIVLVLDLGIYLNSTYFLLASLFIGVFVAGQVGTLYFIKSFRAFIFPLTHQEYIKLIFIGGLLSALGQIIFLVTIKFPILGSNTFLASAMLIITFWQIGMATAIGFVMSKSTQTKTYTTPSKKVLLFALITLFILCGYALYTKTFSPQSSILHNPPPTPQSYCKGIFC